HPPPLRACDIHTPTPRTAPRCDDRATRTVLRCGRSMRLACPPATRQYRFILGAAHGAVVHPTDRCRSLGVRGPTRSAGTRPLPQGEHRPATNHANHYSVRLSGKRERRVAVTAVCGT